ILVEPMTSRKDKEMQRAYRTLMLRLKRAGVVPKKHVIDNEISENMKAMIKDEFACTESTRPRWQFATSNAIFLAFWQGPQTIFRLPYGIDYYRKLKSHSTYYDNPMRRRRFPLTPICVGLSTTTKCH
ncbi:hypothetical protein THAOC_24204, partial [Thalassiosira oceanica]